MLELVVSLATLAGILALGVVIWMQSRKAQPDPAASWPFSAQELAHQVVAELPKPPENNLETHTARVGELELRVDVLERRLEAINDDVKRNLAKNTARVQRLEELENGDLGDEEDEARPVQVPLDNPPQVDDTPKDDMEALADWAASGARGGII